MTKGKDYQTLERELDAVLAKLQEPDVDVDEAVKSYEQGLKLIAELEDYLQQTESTIKRLKLAGAKGNGE